MRGARETVRLSHFWSLMVSVDLTWMKSGACRGFDPDIFFPDPMDLDAVADAKAICALCPVALQCLTFACVTDQQEGIWGGQTERERHEGIAITKLCVVCGGDVVPIGNNRGRCIECQREDQW